MTRTRAVTALGVVTAAALAATVWMALVVTPADVNQRDAVRLLYIHVPTAWLALYLSFGVTTIASALYLWPRTRSRFWDLVAGASAETSRDVPTPNASTGTPLRMSPSMLCSSIPPLSTI